MPLIDCAVGERLIFDDSIEILLTGCMGGVLYVFIDAHRKHALSPGDGFYAGAPCGGGHRAHVLALCDDATFAIGPVQIKVEAVDITLPGAVALRPIRLQVNAPMRCIRRGHAHRPHGHKPHRGRASCCL
jgi:hypothetical protein